MLLAVERARLYEIVSRQLASLLYFEPKVDAEHLSAAIDLTLPKLEFLISRCRSKYYSKDGQPFFNPFHTGQNTIYCYFLSRVAYAELGNENLAERLFYLNKILNGTNIYFTTELPDVFYLDHAVGTVIGRGTFSNYFQFRQNVTVGNNHGKYPRFGRNVQLWSGVTVVGACEIGNNVIFSSGAYVKDTDIPDNCIVFGRSPDIVIKRKDATYFDESDHFRFSVR